MTMIATCRCDSVRLELAQAPFLSTVCYCDDCQEAGRRMEGLEGAPEVREPDGGCAYVLVRKDRVSILAGEENLAEHRLTPSSSTRRVIATCCNTPMFLDVTVAHWLTLYRDRLPEGQRPPIEMRVMTKYRASGTPYPDDAMRYAGHTGRFFLRVLGAWVRMGLKRPKLPSHPPISV